jgi:predicted choloylglycine hydrolase
LALHRFLSIQARYILESCLALEQSHFVNRLVPHMLVHFSLQKAILQKQISNYATATRWRAHNSSVL